LEYLNAGNDGSWILVRGKLRGEGFLGLESDKTRDRSLDFRFKNIMNVVKKVEYAERTVQNLHRKLESWFVSRPRSISLFWIMLYLESWLGLIFSLPTKILSSVSDRWF
jgi:hypothetical protein